MIAIASILFFQATGPGAQAGWANARPQECGVLDGTRGANVWERAKSPELRRYCDLLASGTSKLAGLAGPTGFGSSGSGAAAVAREVLQIADDAERAMPGRAAPKVLRGRALVRIGKFPEALSAFQEAKSKDDRALDDPVALLAWARANARAGKTVQASEAYRALLPRASTLTSSERGAACLEAGILVMTRGAASIDDAVAILRQARREAQDVTQTASVIALALALDRADEHDEARAVLAERVHGDPGPVLGDPRVLEALANSGFPQEGDALAALALEAVDPALARDKWRRYVEGAGGGLPWADHARSREAALAGKKGDKRLERRTDQSAEVEGASAVTRLVVKDVVVGHGREVRAGDRVSVHYTGKLTDGLQFDSSRSRAPFEFQVGRGMVIQGWDTGLLGMKVGGRRKLTIPSEMGYGARGSPPTIPPNATLVFDIELLGVR